MNKPFIIAEAGVNHNGSLKLARKLIDAAAAAAADAVKFQTFKTEDVVTKHAQPAAYQSKNTKVSENQFAMIKRLELSFGDFSELADYCKGNNIKFMSTAFDFASLRFLAYELDLEILKIPSGEITNGPLLLAHAQTGKKIMLSTGISTLGEIEEALMILAFGFCAPDKRPDADNVRKIYFSGEGRQTLKDKVTLLHCTTEYPAPFAQVNLNAMNTMEQAFGLPTGYSDHTTGIIVPAVAAALGAAVIEKHFTLDKNLAGPDHQASLEPDELAAMVKAVKTANTIMGDGCKVPVAAEIPNLNIARRSLVAAEAIRQGEIFTGSNLTAKRPGGGLSPMEYWTTLGKTAARAYEVDELI